MSDHAQRDWAIDLYTAADELGYVILSVGSPGTVELMPVSDNRATIRITSILLSGAMLRATLKPAAPPPIIVVMREPPGPHAES